VAISHAIESLYRSLWGEPARRARFADGRHVIEVLKWDEDATSMGVTLYATVGGSAHAVADGPAGHRVEFILGLSPAQDDVASPLAGLGLYQTHRGEALGHGHTVSSDAPLWSGTQMRVFLVARFQPGFLPPLALPDALHVEFLQALPIYDSERAYASRHGVEALLDLWRRASLPFWEAGRSPLPDHLVERGQLGLDE
jgi:hypothetical protein